MFVVVFVGVAEEDTSLGYVIYIGLVGSYVFKVAFGTKCTECGEVWLCVTERLVWDHIDFYMVLSVV